MKLAGRACDALGKKAKASNTEARGAVLPGWNRGMLITVRVNEAGVDPPSVTYARQRNLRAAGSLVL